MCCQKNVEDLFTNEASFPVTSQKQRAIIDLFHYGSCRLLEPLNSFQRLSLPHEVQSINYRLPKAAYFVIPVLLRFQDLFVRDMSSFLLGIGHNANLLRGREHIPREFRIGMDLQVCQVSMVNVRNNYDNQPTSEITSPIFTNLSRYPMTVSKPLDEVTDEIWCITVPAVSIPDGVEMCEFSAAL